MCEFCETNDANRLFAWLKWAELVVECGVLELETGVVVWGIGGLRD